MEERKREGQNIGWNEERKEVDERKRWEQNREGGRSDGSEGNKEKKAEKGEEGMEVKEIKRRAKQRRGKKKGWK